MIDGNTAALNEYMNIQDQYDQGWKSFKQQLDYGDLIERTIKKYRFEIIEQLIDEPDNAVNAEILLALSEFALYEGTRKNNAWVDFTDRLQDSEFFPSMMHAEQDRMYSEWLDQDRYGQ